jgi:hypothetical protein
MGHGMVCHDRPALQENGAIHEEARLLLAAHADFRVQIEIRVKSASAGFRRADYEKVRRKWMIV